MPWHTQNLVDQLTLFQPGGTDYAHLITTGTPGFSDLPTALKWIMYWCMLKKITYVKKSTRTNNPWEHFFNFSSLHVHTNQTLLLSFPFELEQLEKNHAYFCLLFQDLLSIFSTLVTVRAPL